MNNVDMKDTNTHTHINFSFQNQNDFKLLNWKQELIQCLLNIFAIWLLNCFHFEQYTPLAIVYGHYNPTVYKTHSYITRLWCLAGAKIHRLLHLSNFSATTQKSKKQKQSEKFALKDDSISWPTHGSQQSAFLSQSKGAFVVLSEILPRKHVVVLEDVG